jgi:hypothetical protein
MKSLSFLRIVKNPSDLTARDDQILKQKFKKTTLFQE